MGIQTAVDTGLLAADLNSRFDGMIPENVPLLVAFGLNLQFNPPPLPVTDKVLYV